MGAYDHYGKEARKSAASRRKEETTAGVGVPPSGDRAMAALAGTEGEVGAWVLSLLQIPGGWLRMVPDRDGKTWCKWRYTQGRWEGHYSLAVCDPATGTLAEALRALYHKVVRAFPDGSGHKPTPDRY